LKKKIDDITTVNPVKVMRNQKKNK